ncbi:MAG: alpha/beta fold hydrolase [Gammaproteobacteria bacterium]|jgi:pimeloyl-ACP methyl ester carboxylesterase|nr:alpha/beta fold hydrolase [Gammaproteobacteria bacterium]
MYFDVNGKQVFATTGGKPFDNSKPVVLFLSGSALDHTFWGLQSRFFAFRQYSVLALDTPGHTNSEGPELTSIEAMGDWVNDVVETLGADNLAVVGHSQGCLTALEFVSRYPQKVRCVSFIGSGLATPVNPGLIAAAENDPAAAIDMMISWGFGKAGHLHQGPIPGNSMAAGGWQTMRRNAPGALATDLKACDTYKNGAAAAAKIACPHQVILAGQDRMTPRKAGLKLVEHLANPEFHLIENSGHMIPLEAPDECRSLLRNFIFANNPAS